MKLKSRVACNLKQVVKLLSFLIRFLCLITLSGLFCRRHRHHHSGGEFEGASWEGGYFSCHKLRVARRVRRWRWWWRLLCCLLFVTRLVIFVSRHGGIRESTKCACVLAGPSARGQFVCTAVSTVTDCVSRSVRPRVDGKPPESFRAWTSLTSVTFVTVNILIKIVKFKTAITSSYEQLQSLFTELSGSELFAHWVNSASIC